jgi:hypothetical protein
VQHDYHHHRHAAQQFQIRHAAVVCGFICINLLMIISIFRFSNLRHINIAKRDAAWLPFPELGGQVGSLSAIAPL